jgi:diguanylate cyclase (GGDEF)-like protein
VAADAAQHATDGFVWEAGDQAHMLRYWSVFLESRYGVSPWTVVLTQPSASVHASVNQFKQIFPPVLASALLIVGLLSMTQIRRYLRPLEKLLVGTQKFTSLDLTQQIEVEGKDEIGELATSFNAMARRLNRQFSMLRTLADIDRIVLSSLDADYIVETLLTRIGDVIECTGAGVLLLNEKESGRGELRLVDSATDSSDVLRQPVLIDDRELLGLADSTVLTAPAPECLDGLTTPETTHLVIHPITLDGRTLALLCTGHDHAPDLTDEGHRHVRGLADRTAVAMSNAAWEDTLYHQAHYDSLTDLPNRALLRDRLEQALARAYRDGTLVAVLFLDVDQFKNVNDSFGHGAGDRLLQQLGARLSRRGTDTVVRFGGDEFVVVISDLPDDEHVGTTIAGIADELCTVCAEPVSLGEHRMSVTVSIGISVFPRDATDSEDLLRHADTAMYHGKTRGKASYHFYSPEQNAALMERLELATDLRVALEKDQLELYYQPQICATTGDIIGTEALLRWHHPGRGLITPDVFIPIAEETDLIETVGAWVMRNACRQLKSWHDAGLPRFRVAINVAARQFLSDSFVDDVRQALLDSGLPGRYLEVEMTERALMSDVERTSTALHELARMDVQISIDDFGTGYSSLAYLARFPIDVLKIDQSFVADLTRDPAVHNIIRTIVELGHGLGLTVVAEGIESYDQFRQLRELGCDHIQGFLVDRPMPASQIMEFASYWNSTRQHDFFDVTALRPILRA